MTDQSTVATGNPGNPSGLPGFRGRSRVPQKTLDFGGIGETISARTQQVRCHEIPSCHVGGCGLSGCGRLGPLFLLNVPKSDNSSRTGCVESRPSNSTNRARQFSFPLRHWCLLGSSCEYCYLWIGRSNRGDPAARTKSGKIIQNSPPLGCREN